VEVSTIYKYLVGLEKSKKVTKYDMSHLKITRTENKEGFDIVQTPHKFIAVNVGNKGPPATTSTNYFRPGSRAVEKLKDSKYLMVLARYKYERVQNISKILKPYVVLKAPLTLTVGKPIKVRALEHLPSKALQGLIYSLWYLLSNLRL
jgi:hypothetical protein